MNDESLYRETEAIATQLLVQQRICPDHQSALVTF